MKKQSIIWLLSGFIITTPILIFFIYRSYLLTYPIIQIAIIISWLSAGFWFYKEILKTDDDNNIFTTIFSFIWLPYVVFSVFIGMVLGLTFTKKKNAQFLTGDIWE